MDSCGAAAPQHSAKPAPIFPRSPCCKQLRLRVIGDVTESNVLSVIKSEAAVRQFVFIDLEGTASRLVSRAISRADLVIIPCRPAPLMRARRAAPWR